MWNPPTTRIHADEFRREHRHHLPGDRSGHSKEAQHLILLEVVPPGHMPLGDDQQWPLV